MRRHSENALAVAKFLENHPRVAWVNYCALPSSKYFGLCQKYLPNGASGVIAFGVQGGREASVAFMERLTLGAIVTHVADARTSLLHPASTTHRQLSEAELIEAGVSQDLIRLSVGIENAEDIVRDLEKALAVDS